MVLERYRIIAREMLGASGNSPAQQQSSESQHNNRLSRSRRFKIKIKTLLTLVWSLSWQTICACHEKKTGMVQLKGAAFFLFCLSRTRQHPNVSVPEYVAVV